MRKRKQSHIQCGQLVEWGTHTGEGIWAKSPVSERVAFFSKERNVMLVCDNKESNSLRQCFFMEDKICQHGDSNFSQVIEIITRGPLWYDMDQAKPRSLGLTLSLCEPDGHNRQPWPLAYSYCHVSPSVMRSKPIPCGYFDSIGLLIQDSTVYLYNFSLCTWFTAPWC